MFKIYALAFLVITAGLVFECDSATFIVPPHLATHPDHPGKCWDADTKKVVSPGEYITSVHCVRLTCRNNLSFSGATCGLTQVHVGGEGIDCKDLPGDLTREYPDCCAKKQCVDNEGRIAIF